MTYTTAKAALAALAGDRPYSISYAEIVTGDRVSVNITMGVGEVSVCMHLTYEAALAELREMLGEVPVDQQPDSGKGMVICDHAFAVESCAGCGHEVAHPHDKWEKVEGSQCRHNSVLCGTTGHTVRCVPVADRGRGE